MRICVYKYVYVLVRQIPFPVIEIILRHKRWRSIAGMNVCLHTGKLEPDHCLSAGYTSNEVDQSYLRTVCFFASIVRKPSRGIIFQARAFYPNDLAVTQNAGFERRRIALPKTNGSIFGHWAKPDSGLRFPYGRTKVSLVLRANQCQPNTSMASAISLGWWSWCTF